MTGSDRTMQSNIIDVCFILIFSHCIIYQCKIKKSVFYNNEMYELITKLKINLICKTNQVILIFKLVLLN